MDWAARTIPDQSGRTFVVTGANSGIGLEAARTLAEHGAHVVLACRNLDKARTAATDLPGTVSVRGLDLADLASVRTFAEATDEFDVLINNAGIMAVPHGRTADGFELQFGTNFLGPFALTGLLLPKIRDRVVTLSSLMHRLGRIDIEDPNWERRRYERWSAYAQSKLADLMFAVELARRLTGAGSAVTSVAAHPGYSATNLGTHTGNHLTRVITLGNRIIAQGATAGSWPTLYAACLTGAGNGSYTGPGGVGEIRGLPQPARMATKARDGAVAGRLWQLAEELTGVSYPLDASATD